MIDTVILTLPKYKVKNEQGNDKLGFDAQSQNKFFSKWVKNPTKDLLESGNYYPRLTGIKRMQEYFVKIEFSVPKILYGNNLDELEDKDFNLVVDTLQKRLEDMGVYISKLDLAEAKVSAIHFSKNIELKDGVTAQYVIRQIRKTNKRKSFDNTDFRYGNDGQSIQFYSKAHSFVIYDKIADLHKNEKRAIDKDTNKFQASLFDELAKETEVVRFEVRLSEYQKLKGCLKEVGFNEDLKFNRLFSSSLSQKIVMKYWKSITDKSKICFYSFGEPKQILEQICIKFPKLKANKKIQLVGLLLLAKDDNGITELRTILCKNNTDRNWYRIAKDFQELTKTLQELNVRDWVKQIEQGLNNYSKYKQTK